MKNPTTFLTVILLLFLAGDISAQAPRRRGSGRPAAPKPATREPAAQPAPSPTPEETPAAPMAPVLLATVNGQNITTADIDPRARQEVEALEGKIADARRQILELEINTLLLDVEARKRRVSPQQLYESEVGRKITQPTQAEITKFIDENRERIDESDSPTIRTQVADFLKGEQEAKLSEELLNRLRTSNVVGKGADVNDIGLPPTTVLATVAGRTVTAGAVNERLKPIDYQLRFDTYLVEKPALDQTINDLLLLAESKNRNVPPEDIVRKEITEKVRPPTDAEVEKFYNDNKNSLKGDLATLRNQIAAYMEEQNRLKLEQEFSARLRKGADLRVLVVEPEPPVQSISVDDDPVQGDANAAVTIVEFTDFQCPACAAMHPVIDEVLKLYGNKVRLVVRDFPLAMHANARKAAEAANAAHAQGKFFEYAALLFKRQNALDIPSLKKYATELGLDRVRFDGALDSGKYAPEVKHDMDDGQIYGVGSTPTIFVNGRMLKGLSSEALRAAINQALSKSGAKQ
ncbi:MAG TPA: thioredoxin domain-containing protein [Pyrinomonadaceae bacterium]|nr:thioredoxin domain-containing protein [Pyrinomonadaceae bacterium]